MGGTPMREFNPMGGPDPPLSAKSTSFSNDSDAYRAVYQSQNSSNHNASKTHQRVKSFSHFLPGWFNNTTKEIQVEVVVEQNKDDYYDVSSDSKTKTESPGSPEEVEQLLTSYVDTNNELHLEITDDQSCSTNSSSEKKTSTTITNSTKGSSSNSSKKTLMTNLSGLKSEIDLCSAQHPLLA